MRAGFWQKAEGRKTHRRATLRISMEPLSDESSILALVCTTVLRNHWFLASRMRFSFRRNEVRELPGLCGRAGAISEDAIRVMVLGSRAAERHTGNGMAV